ncbi:hypothetical protein [Actinomadura madurae]|uniref:hypothetical protein n=1 Tax=Actinomadura madurae TaxID=1993 RepID=UPI0020D21645|nr:hypothetical protein [Actinomadura madurae]MCQ0015838.1 hypothetical protein [Actinomadura madurae]
MRERLPAPLVQDDGRDRPRDAPPREAGQVGDGPRGGGRLGEQQVQQPAAAVLQLARLPLAGRGVALGGGAGDLVQEREDRLGDGGEGAAGDVVPLGLGGEPGATRPGRRAAARSAGPPGRGPRGPRPGRSPGRRRRPAPRSRPGP